jgi:hypothetical protein
VAEIDADHRAGASVESNQNRRPADLPGVGAVLARALGYETGALEVGHEARDRASGKARYAGNFRSGSDTTLAQRLDNEAAIGIAKGLQPTGCQRDLSTRRGPYSPRSGFVKTPNELALVKRRFCSGMTAP